MSKGRKRTPTALLSLRGSWRGNHREAEPIPTGRPAVPEWLTPRAIRMMRKLIQQLTACQILTAVDQNALARYCQIFDRWRQADEWISANGQIAQTPAGPQIYPHVVLADRLAETCRKLECQFGLTPSARASLKVQDKPAQAASGKNRFFGATGT